MCALIGLPKTPYMIDYAQVLFIIGLNNIHYPLHLRSMLEDAGLSFLNGFAGIEQDKMNGKGKLAYVVNNGLLSNAFGNIVIIIIGLGLTGLGYVLMKFL